MPAKTERILTYLPGTFRAREAGPSVLRSVVDAFGRELLAAEDSLAALMQAHWVEHADRGAAEIDDLARLASLYGLAPRSDEGVEEFREHLKRFVWTFLEGTATVQGVLRVAAEALGLTLADAPEELDSWWRRGGAAEERPFVTRAVVTQEAASELFGFVTARAEGRASEPAQVTGRRAFLAADLSIRRRLRLAVDGGAPFELDAAGPVPARTFLDEAVAAINAVRPGLASATDDGRLRLTSPTTGPESRMELLPLRHLEVEEYPPVPAEARAVVHHGGALEAVNSGAADVPATAEITAPRGACGPGLADLHAGWSVRLLTCLEPRETARLRRGPGGEVAAEVVGRAGIARPLPPEAVSVTGDAPLLLPRGRSRWLYLECGASRFDEAQFGAAAFAGGPCSAWAIFDASGFAGPEDGEEALFAPSGPPPDPPVEVALRWRSHQPGAFRVNLPADLPPRFGGRFDSLRFGPAGPELFPDAVTGPADDPRHLARLLAASRFVEAEVVPRPPVGFEAVPMPFREPRRLARGDERAPARLYLAGPGLVGVLEVRAREPGAWGEEIAVAARRAGAARFEVAVHYRGGVFENARRAVRGDLVPARAEDLLGAGRIGVLHAKAAGVRAEVTRDRAEPPESQP
jgi:hypothetical protein